MAFLQTKRRAGSYNIKNRKSTIKNENVQVTCCLHTPSVTDMTEDSKERKKTKGNVKDVIIKKLHKVRSYFRRSTSSKNAEEQDSRDRHPGDMNQTLDLYSHINKPKDSRDRHSGEEMNPTLDVYCSMFCDIAIHEDFEDYDAIVNFSYPYRNAGSEPIPTNVEVDVEEEALMDVHWPAPPPPPDVYI